MNDTQKKELVVLYKKLKKQKESNLEMIQELKAQRDLLIIETQDINSKMEEIKKDVVSKEEE